MTDFLEKAKSIQSDPKLTLSGYSIVEEMAIINNFKRKLSLGRSLESAQNSTTGLSLWTIRRQTATGVKRFIDSKMYEIAAQLKMKKIKKLAPGQAALLKRYNMNDQDVGKQKGKLIYRGQNNAPFDCWMAEAYSSTMESLPLANSIVSSSKNSLYFQSSVSINSIVNEEKSSILQAKLNKSGVSLSLSGDLEEIDKKLIKAAEKANAMLDDLELHNKDPDVAKVISHAVRAEDAYQNLFDDGKFTNDYNKINQWLDVITNERTKLLEEEKESLDRYNIEGKDAIIKEMNKIDHHSKTDELISNIHDHIDDIELDLLKVNWPTLDNDFEQLKLIKEKQLEVDQDLYTEYPEYSEEKDKNTDEKADIKQKVVIKDNDDNIENKMTEPIETKVNSNPIIEGSIGNHEIEEEKMQCETDQLCHPNYFIEEESDYLASQLKMVQPRIENCLYFSDFHNYICDLYKVPRDFLPTECYLTRSKFERFIYHYKRGSIIFNKDYSSIRMEDPKKADKLNKDFISFWKKFSGDKLIIKEKTVSIDCIKSIVKQAVKEKFVNPKIIKNYKDEPERNLKVLDKEKTEYESRKTDEYNARAKIRDEAKPGKIATLLKQKEKLEGKIKSIKESKTIHERFIMINLPLLNGRLKDVEQELNELKRPTHYAKKFEYYKSVPNPEHRKYLKQINSSYYDQFKMGLIDADVRPTLYEITDVMGGIVNLAANLNRKLEFDDERYFVLNNIEFFGPYRHEPNDNSTKIKINYRIVDNSSPPDFRSISESIYKSVVNKLGGGPKRSLTREFVKNRDICFVILCSIISFGRLSKRVINTRKRYRKLISEEFCKLFKMDFLSKSVLCLR